MGGFSVLMCAKGKGIASEGPRLVNKEQEVVAKGCGDRIRTGWNYLFGLRAACLFNCQDTVLLVVG